jgi:hypothetical protein
MALPGTCKIHGNVEMEERASKQLLKLDLENATTYVLLLDIYATVGKRDLSENVERQRKESVW